MRKVPGIIMIALSCLHLLSCNSNNTEKSTNQKNERKTLKNHYLTKVNMLLFGKDEIVNGNFTGTLEAQVCQLLNKFFIVLPGQHLFNMAKNKTIETQNSVADFLTTITDEKKRK